MIRIVSLADAPELEDALWDLASVWPRFMLEDPVASLYYGDLERWADKVLLAVDHDGSVVARSFRVTFAMGDDIGRSALPGRGWDAIVEWAYLDDVRARAPTHTSALEIGIIAEQRGTGLAGDMIRAMAVSAAADGFDELLAPVRPSRKAEEPETPMVEYVERRRDDGLPFDPWIRAHVRLGAAIETVCPASMTITGTLQDWRSWTGMAFDRSGPTIVAGALVPVHVSVEHDHAVYVEPNVWMRHRL